MIGGTTPASRNVISGNDERGVEINDATFTRALGNRLAGVAITGSNVSNHKIGDRTRAGSNTIAFNGGDGVNISAGVRNAIKRNSIFPNAGLGIDLKGGTENQAGATANDPGDKDSDPNDLQNRPALTSARTVSGKTTVKGKLASQPNSGYTIQFFSNPKGTNEGKRVIGEKSIIHTDGSGEVTFTFSPATRVPAGRTVTATAQANNFDASIGDTSEFSAPRTVKSS